MIFILAEDFRTAAYIAHKNQVPRELWTYPRDATAFQGLRDFEVWYIGPWYMDRDPEVVEEILAAIKHIKDTAGTVTEYSVDS